MFVQDFIINGQGHGPMAQTLAGVRFDPGLLRPFFETDPKNRRFGQRCVTMNTGRMIWNQKLGRNEPLRKTLTLNEVHNLGVQLPPVVNSTVLRKEEWIELDRVVLKAARYNLRAWNALAGANSFSGFNGMGKMILEHETSSDPGEAFTDMDALSTGRNDAPQYQLEGLPLPITHSGFWFGARKLAASRNSGTPLDTAMGEAAGRRVAEQVEKMTIGNIPGLAYGGASGVGGYSRTSQVYGYTTFPTRLTKSNMTAPTAGGWTPETLQREVNVCLNLLRARKFSGPFMIYTSNDWDPYLDGDYYAGSGSAVATSQTVRQRIRAIDGIIDIRRLDFLFSSMPVTNPALSTYRGPGGEGTTAAGNPFTLIFVQMTPDVARAVIGQDLTTIQWEERGGMLLNVRVICIYVPQLRADFYGNCGILHATTA